MLQFVPKGDEKRTVENKIAKTLECALRGHSHELSQITWHSAMGLLLGIRLETIEGDFEHTQARLPRPDMANIHGP